MNKPSDYIAEMFHKLREDISDIKHRLFTEKPKLESVETQPHYAIDAVYKDNQSSEKDDKAIRTTLNLPKSIYVDAKTEERHKPWYKDRSVWLSVITIVVGTVVALIYIGQLCQMIKSNRLTQQTLQISQRAYVAIGRKDGIAAEFDIPNDPAADVGITIYFQNGGHLPARFNWGTVAPPILIPARPGSSPTFEAKHQFSPMMRVKHPDGGIEQRGGGVIAGDSLYPTDIMEIPRHVFDSFIKENSQVFAINGVYEYCDGFGAYECRNFVISYRGSPYDRFAVDIVGGCEGVVSRPKTDPAGEVLSPCGDQLPSK